MDKKKTDVFTLFLAAVRSEQHTKRGEIKERKTK